MRVLAVGNDLDEAVDIFGINRTLEQLFPDIVFGEVSHGNVQLVAHVAPQCLEHLFVERLLFVGRHVSQCGFEALERYFIGPLMADQRGVLQLFQVLAQVEVQGGCDCCQHGQCQPIGPAAEVKVPPAVELRFADADKTDVLVQYLQVFLADAADDPGSGRCSAGRLRLDFDVLLRSR